MRQVTQLDDHKMRVITELKVDARTVPIEEVDQFNTFLEQLRRHSGLYFTGQL